MIRKLLTVVLPFLLPFIIYGFYLAIQKRKARKAGNAPHGGWSEAPWGVILMAAVVLVAISLVTYRFTIEERWEDPKPPSVSGDPSVPPAGEGVIRPEDREKQQD
jgi:hypothetical protein